ncbi:hypothetical protein [Brucella intermedia]|uniref:hypothetical protein n=1 Tax=Brucella intermedia TaxID=94625 RepID=UPI002360301C|nr:hypothetical protein [Brucella intermedia]
MHDLLRMAVVRRCRLDRACQEVAKARREFGLAGQNLSKAEYASERFLEETYSLETNLLQSVLHTKVSCHTLLAIEEKLRKAEQQAKELAEEMAQARLALKIAGESAEAAARSRNLRQKKLMTCEELRAHLVAANRREAEKSEDRELDEFSLTRWARY